MSVRLVAKWRQRTVNMVITNAAFRSLLEKTKDGVRMEMPEVSGIEWFVPDPPADEPLIVDAPLTERYPYSDNSTQSQVG